jgi:hypothetical protein
MERSNNPFISDRNACWYGSFSSPTAREIDGVMLGVEAAIEKRAESGIVFRNEYKHKNFCGRGKLREDPKKM